jgi:hypothetical protein
MIIGNNTILSERSVIFFFLMKSAEFVNSFINLPLLFKIIFFLINFKYLISKMEWIFEKLDNPKMVMLLID